MCLRCCEVIVIIVALCSTLSRVFFLYKKPSKTSKPPNPAFEQNTLHRQAYSLSPRTTAFPEGCPLGLYESPPAHCSLPLAPPVILYINDHFHVPLRFLSFTNREGNTLVEVVFVLLYSNLHGSCAFRPTCMVTSLTWVGCEDSFFVLCRGLRGELPHGSRVSS